MVPQENNEGKTNWGMVSFTVIAGLILLSNLFEYITWDIWKVGIYIAGVILLSNFLYRTLRKKSWAYKTFQIVMIFLVFTLLSHTVLGIMKPGYLKPHPPDLTAYEIYSTRMELRTGYYSEIVAHKDIKVTVSQKEYSIKDSNDDYYYLRTHPPKGDNSNIFVGHRIVNTDLLMEIESTDYKLSPIQKLIGQHPSVIIGNPQIPADFEINTKEEGILNVDLKNQRIEIMKGLILGGETKVKLSTNSLPKSKFTITTRGGNTEISLPREISHQIKYSTKETGTLIIEGNEVVRRGEYEIITGQGENPCVIEINAEGGYIKIVTH